MEFLNKISERRNLPGHLWGCFLIYKAVKTVEKTKVSYLLQCPLLKSQDSPVCSFFQITHSIPPWPVFLSQDSVQSISHSHSITVYLYFVHFLWALAGDRSVLKKELIFILWQKRKLIYCHSVSAQAIFKGSLGIKCLNPQK